MRLANKILGDVIAFMLRGSFQKTWKLFCKRGLLHINSIVSVIVWIFVFYISLSSPYLKYLYAQSMVLGGRERVLSEGHEDKMPVNPHWKNDLCDECHAGTPEKGKPLSFKYNGDFIKLCDSCHGIMEDHAYIHATGMVPSKEKLAIMPEDFKTALYRGDKGGRLTCVVCHNLVYQCLKKERWRRRENLLFFRGGPYLNRTDICLHCHDMKKYTRLNPHDQINDEGEIRKSVCSVCHKGTPDVKMAKGIGDVRFKVKKGLSRLCRRCHKNVTKHPGTFIGDIEPSLKDKKDTKKPASHLVVPPPSVLKRLKKTTVEKDIVMPLEPGTNKVFCATCHNPHERGIQRFARADKGADNEQRLRAARRNDICLMCHNI